MDTLPSLASVAIVVLALGFTYTNGFHDAANAIATSVSTRALTPRIALALAAVMNLLGAFVGVRVATTIGSDIVVVPQGPQGVALCAGALLGAICWNLITWARGMPSSSTHALIGGLGGAAVVAAGSIHWDSVVRRVIVPMVLSPALGLIGGFAVMAVILRVFRKRNPGSVSRGFRYAQTASAAAMAFGHGMQDGTKAAGVVVLGLAAGGVPVSIADGIPGWLVALSALVLSLGTYAGGWRIMRTLGRRIIALDPPQGFAAETTAATVLYLATATGAPVSTTHAITAAIMGVGSTRSRKAVRWDVARDIVWAWVLTFPGAALLGALFAGIGVLLT